VKFKQITLVNFMRYKGENTLRFSTDDKMNVTAILGNNTFGKTTIAQAFRWGLYGEVTTTNYAKKEKAVLLSNEIIAGLDVNTPGEVRVEITVSDKASDTEHEYKFVRRQLFKRISQNPNNYDIQPVSNSRLSVLISADGVPSEEGPIDNDFSRRHPAGYVQDMINNMFPEKLSAYFFFDGERWNENKNKTDEVKRSINTILGVSSILKMKEHLKDGSKDYKTTVYQRLNRSIKGSSKESQDLKSKISANESTIARLEKDLEHYGQDYEVAKTDKERYAVILENNRSAEEDQKELKNLENRIESNKRRMEGNYRDFIQLFSKADKLLTSELLPSVERLFSQLDLKGKDIPGVTSDTIDWLIEHKKCLCGEELTPGHAHYEALMKLRDDVYPNKIGGPAKLLQSRLNDWANESADLIDKMHHKAIEYEDFQKEIGEAQMRSERIEERIDRRQNLQDVRKRYNRARQNEEEATRKKGETTGRIDSLKNNNHSLNVQLCELEAQDKANRPYVRAIEYVNALYEIAEKDIERLERPTIRELNDIIAGNFEKMFNSKDKYARLENDYKIHMYYRSLGGHSDFEETRLSNGELIAINFVYIVSILELAKKRQEKESKESGVLRLPLVLDAPFSNLSSENTHLVANKLPEFAEQVIIFMLDKDWEASGLKDYTLPDYCYRIYRDFSANSSTLTTDGGEF